MSKICDTCETAIHCAKYGCIPERIGSKPAQQQQEQKYLEDLHNALQRIDTAAVGLPTFEVRHEGGLDAVTQNIVDAITALHTQPAQRKPLTEEEIGAMWVTARRNSPVPHVVFARAIEAAHGIKENT